MIERGAMDAIAPPTTISQTELLNEQPETSQATQQVLRLRLQKPRNERRVGWTEGTLDNEHLNRKKSKCCCIFKKQTKFGESSSEDDEECEHCFGHPEKRKKNRKGHKHDHCEHDELHEIQHDQEGAGN